jgi:hypothetical protein
MKLPVERGTLLTGKSDDVRELAAVLGVIKEVAPSL